MRRWVVAGVAAAALIVVVLVAIGPGRVVDAYDDWANHLQDEVASLPEHAGDPAGAGSASDAILLAVADEGGQGVAFAVLTVASDGTAVLAVVPAGLYDLVPGYGEFALGDSLRFEGAELAALVVANTLGIEVGAAVVLPAAELAELFDEPVPIELVSPLVETRDDGTVVRVAAEGNLGRDGAVVAELFANPGDGELLEYLERQAATWQGMVRHVGASEDLTGRVAAFAGAEGGLVEEGLGAAADGPLDVTLIPLSRVGGGADEGFEVDAEELPGFVERRFAHVALRTGERPTVELLNGNGRLLSTRWAAAALIGEGFRVIRTDNADRFDFETTIVVAQGEEHTDAAAEVVQALGVGELRLELTAPSGIVDVSIIVGQDVPAGEG